MPFRTEQIRAQEGPSCAEIEFAVPCLEDLHLRTQLARARQPGTPEPESLRAHGFFLS